MMNPVKSRTCLVARSCLLAEQDHPQVFSFLQKEASKNLFIIYGLKGYEAEGFSKIILSHKHSMISGDKSVLEALEAHIPMNTYEKVDTYFSECSRESMEVHDDKKLEDVYKI